MIRIRFCGSRASASSQPGCAGSPCICSFVKGSISLWFDLVKLKRGGWARGSIDGGAEDADGAAGRALGLAADFFDGEVLSTAEPEHCFLQYADAEMAAGMCFRAIDAERAVFAVQEESIFLFVKVHLEMAVFRYGAGDVCQPYPDFHARGQEAEGEVGDAEDVGEALEGVPEGSLPGALCQAAPGSRAVELLETATQAGQVFERKAEIKIIGRILGDVGGQAGEVEDRFHAAMPDDFFQGLEKDASEVVGEVLANVLALLYGHGGSLHSTSPVAAPVRVVGDGC